VGQAAHGRGGAETELGCLGGEELELVIHVVIVHDGLSGSGRVAFRLGDRDARADRADRRLGA
jgi:hypothetical protein